MSFDSLDSISRTNPEYVDQLYRQYKQDPNSVDPKWALVFLGYEFGRQSTSDSFEGDPINPPGVYDLIHSYRELGHLMANVNPLEDKPETHPLLKIDQFGFSEKDLDKEIHAGPYRGLNNASLKVLINSLHKTYCGTLSVEFMHLFDQERRDWLTERMEPTRNRPPLNDQGRLVVLKQLISADGFERFLHSKYRGTKRFSLEGNLSLIPLLNMLVEQSVSLGAKEFVFGMPHRGRLNVLAHLMHKPYELILAEFLGLQEAEDVKYHLGYSHDLELHSGKTIHLSLSANPSHLEAVDPVVLGMVRAKQSRYSDKQPESVVPVLMHGDAAFTGQGIVYETLGLSNLEGFTVGGSIHILINNQIGFTTDPEQSRSTQYASDLAKILQAPIFHVNADDPEAVVWAAELAIEFRQQFKTDVFIDLIGYRRHGHNELDDPSFTQPLMYQKIKQHPLEVDIYAKRLIENKVITEAEVKQLQQDTRAELDNCLAMAQKHENTLTSVMAFDGLWKGFGSSTGKDWNATTRVDADVLHSIAKSLVNFPDTFTPHGQIPKLFDKTSSSILEGENMPWVAGETLAYGTLLLEGLPIRLTGQDSGRGTFSHRHAVLHDAVTGENYVPLNHINGDQAQIEIVDSPLNEAAVMGFEYGLARVNPHQLVIWEAQFGDFANGAQTIIDQFIASGEIKWALQCGLVLLLPHGYEGQGPEHSSARLERFLQLCAEDNMQVVNCSTPAQFFHALRRQARREFRKPLIVLTPKSLLRHKAAVSSLEEFTEMDFQTVLPDVAQTDVAQTKRVLLCSGKIYYALEAEREARKANDIAILRLEQFYPFPDDVLKTMLEPYIAANAEMVWVQEEPKNQGAWPFLQPLLSEVIGRSPCYVGRKASASPATGSLNVHQAEEKALLDMAFDLSNPAQNGSIRHVHHETPQSS